MAMAVISHGTTVIGMLKSLFAKAQKGLYVAESKAAFTIFVVVQLLESIVVKLTVSAETTKLV